MSAEGDLIGSMKMDRSALTISSLSEEGDDRAYWRQATPDERLLALEFMRQVCNGYNPLTDRLQRLLTITELGAS